MNITPQELIWQNSQRGNPGSPGQPRISGCFEFMKILRRLLTLAVPHLKNIIDQYFSLTRFPPIEVTQDERLREWDDKGLHFLVSASHFFCPWEANIFSYIPHFLCIHTKQFTIIMTPHFIFSLKRSINGCCCCSIILRAFLYLLCIHTKLNSSKLLCCSALFFLWRSSLMDVNFFRARFQSQSCAYNPII